jgi:caffeoyl-CoA O-methyltransferase
MEILNQLATEYIEKNTAQLPPLFMQLLEHTNATHAKAHMISGLAQGQFLSFISQMLKPANVLEIGTFTGFSALCLAQGLAKNGVLHTIELRAEDAAVAQQYFDKSEHADKIKLHVGDAKEVLTTLLNNWDLIFVDADKVNYIAYYELTLPQLKEGGFMVVDNTLFHGQVLHENVTGKNAIAIDAFNKHINEDDRVEQVMLTIRDGITLIRKK